MRHRDESAPSSAWRRQARALAGEERDAAWAERIERALLSQLDGDQGGLHVECFSSQCLLQMRRGLTWDEIEEELDPVWNHRFELVVQGEDTPWVRLWRHPADRSGTSADGMPSVGDGPSDPCLAGFSCEKSVLGRLELEQRDASSLCFMEEGELCACARQQGNEQACPGYEY